MKELILDIFLPRLCLGCGKEGQYICRDCEIFLGEVPPSKEVLSVWEYEGLMEKLIQKIKFDGCYHIIDELVEKALTKIELNLPENCYLTFVPMYRRRERERGFNQAELIAKALAKRIDRKVICLLRKIRDNKSQVNLSPKEREENVRDVFCVRPDLTCMPENVLLVDDVYTTGATVRECIKTLKRAGAKNVWAFTLARKLAI